MGCGWRSGAHWFLASDLCLRCASSNNKKGLLGAGEGNKYCSGIQLAKRYALIPGLISLPPMVTAAQCVSGRGTRYSQSTFPDIQHYPPPPTHTKKTYKHTGTPYTRAPAYVAINSGCSSFMTPSLRLYSPAGLKWLPDGSAKRTCGRVNKRTHTQHQKTPHNVSQTSVKPYAAIGVA